MDQLKEQYVDFEKELENLIGNNEHFKLISEKTQQPKGRCAVGIMVLLTGFLYWLFGGQFFTNLVGFGYPAFASMKAIETKQKDDDKQWLTYWVVFAGFNLFEYVFLSWIPDWFFPVKIAGLLWLFLPQFNGAVKVYELGLQKIMAKIETVKSPSAPEKEE